MGVGIEVSEIRPESMQYIKTLVYAALNIDCTDNLDVGETGALKFELAEIQNSAVKQNFPAIDYLLGTSSGVVETLNSRLQRMPLEDGATVEFRFRRTAPGDLTLYVYTSSDGLPLVKYTIGPITEEYQDLDPDL